MLYFDKLSIRSKLIAIVLFVTVFSVIAGSAYVIFRDIQEFRSDMVANTLVTARIISDYSVVDLAFSDKTESAKTLSRLHTIPGIVCAYLYTPDGKVFSAYRRTPDVIDIPPVQQSLVQFKAESLEIFQPVVDQGQNYGTLYLRASTKPLQEKIRKLLLTGALMILVLVVVGFILASLLQRVISKPILRLADAAKMISRKEDYSIRVDTSSQDEVGFLCDAFNTMLEQIEKRQKERDKAERGLRESEDRYRGLVESSFEMIFVEQDSHLVYMNRAGLRQLGYANIEELQTMSLTDLIPEELREPFQELSSGQTATRAPIETKLRRKDKKVLEVELSFIPTLYRGRAGTQGIARDITESKTLRQAAQRMERLAALGELSATIAHEIRNALGSISLNFQNLFEKLEIPPIHRNTFQNMELGIIRIQNLMKGILDFARPTPPVLSAISTHKLLDSSIHSVEKEFADAGITIVKNYGQIPYEIYIDSNQILQVLLNLFFNAKHAMKEGGQLKIKTEMHGECVEVRLEDTGEGIPEENLDKIFNPFFTTTPDGVGLGLAIVSRILEQHKAQILVESKVGSGTAFIIRFSLVAKPS